MSSAKKMIMATCVLMTWGVHAAPGGELLRDAALSRKIATTYIRALRAQGLLRAQGAATGEREISRLVQKDAAKILLPAVRMNLRFEDTGAEKLVVIITRVKSVADANCPPSERTKQLLGWHIVSGYAKALCQNTTHRSAVNLDRYTWAATKEKGSELVTHTTLTLAEFEGLVKEAEARVVA